MNRTTYNYNGYRPYGAGEAFIIDGHIKSGFDGFDGNATEEAIKNGATFKIIDELHAVLSFKDMNVDFVKGV